MTVTEIPTPAALARVYFDGAKAQEELRGNWVMVALHRWPGFVIVPLCLRQGIGADAVTLAGMAVTLSLPVWAVLLPAGAAAWTVCLLAHLVIVLDCVDGDVARWSGTTSARGARLDLIGDMAFWGVLYGSIGLLADGGTAGAWSALALAAAWGRLLARVINDSVGGAPTVDDGGGWTAGGVAVAFVAGLSGAIPFLALAAAGAPWVVWLLVGYSLIDLVDAIVRVLGKDPR
ncbi:CDP-alcohol phosphatidyltransferase family protein [Pseudooceanicola sp. LIPI14-2-Ac024]|uniref:CDP-alcohol phosphatidyltransferase family protein n=1 Tax=Pseudooceanicola sp. LIPI14-2-Ac024 TaxID=3344875 RepID=UPI0035CF90E8